MDMKKILQVLDNNASTPVENSNDIRRSLEILNEGANPHKVSLPVQMAIQHYQAPSAEPKPKKDSILKKYFAEAEQEAESVRELEEQRIKMYSRKIAQKVLGESNSNRRSIQPTIEDELVNPEDTIKLDVPLLIRLLEYAREDAKTDMDLHNVAEMLINLSREGNTLSMDHYDQIVGDQKMLPSSTDEGKDPCWKGYRQLGTNTKNDHSVPNCITNKKRFR